LSIKNVYKLKIRLESGSESACTSRVFIFEEIIYRIREVETGPLGGEKE
jgi:hypothetical protein